ncbi:MAG: cellulose binding domain-containing protein, partial [Cyanobacteria bacterium J06621_8]
MNTSLVNKNTFNLQSKITNDWGGSHRIVINLEALSDAKDWNLGIDLPENYRIDQIYGAELTQEGDQLYISGVSWNQSLSQGSKTEIVFIIDEGASSSESPKNTEFIFADSVPSESTSMLNTNSHIVEDWQGGYKLELDITAESEANDWQINFNLPYSIRDVYGADLITNDDGSYTITGQNGQANLQAGQSIRPIFIIDDGGEPALELDVIAEEVYEPAPEVPEPAPEVPEPAPEVPEAENQMMVSSSITEDWQGGYKLELDITAESEANDWQINFNLPYSIRNVYGVDLVTNNDGSYTITGQNGQANLQAGQSIRPIFIIDDGGEAALELDIINGEVPEPAPEVPEPAPEVPEPAPEIPEPAPEVPEPENQMMVSPEITEDWQGGYKLELAIEAEAEGNNWQIDFNLPYSIREVYGADLIDNGNGNYTIMGQSNQASLQAGQSIRPIFIIDDGGQQALNPEFTDSVTVVEPEPAPTPEPIIIPPVDIPETPGESVGQQGQFSYGEALQKNFLFFEAN